MLYPCLLEIVASELSGIPVDQEHLTFSLIPETSNEVALLYSRKLDNPFLGGSLLIFMIANSAFQQLAIVLLNSILRDMYFKNPYLAILGIFNMCTNSYYKCQFFKV